MNPPATINPTHEYAVYEYTDKVSDPYYIGRRYISVNNCSSGRTVIVATADTIEECQQHIESKPSDLLEWMLHQDRQTGGALSQMISGADNAEVAS